jgi:hypothetical protein
MNRRWKFIVPTLALVMAFCAVSVASAAAAESAPRWKVAGAFLGAGVAKPFKAVSSSVVKLKVPELPLELESAAGKCSSSGNAVGSALEKPGSVSGVKLRCEGVSVVGAPKCSVRDSEKKELGVVETNVLAGSLVWLNKVGNAAGVKLKPAEGVLFVTLELVGGECGLAGSYKVEKEVLGNLLPVAEEVAVGSLEFPEVPVLKWWNNAVPRVEQALEQLKVKAKLARFVGNFNLELVSKEKVGVFPG